MKLGVHNRAVIDYYWVFEHGNAVSVLLGGKLNGIKDFITNASKQFEEPEDHTRQAVGAILRTLRSTVDSSDFRQLEGALPGATELIAAPEAAPTLPRGLGGAMGPMATEFGGAIATSGTFGLMAMIQKSGFAPTKVAGLVKKFMELVEGKAGDGLVAKLLTQLPELATLAA